MINSQTAKLLRRWIVAGLAAALALAWTITTLVAPSQAASDQTYNISDTFSGTSSQQSVSLNMAGGWNKPGAILNPTVDTWSPQWQSYEDYAAQNNRSQAFKDAVARNYVDNTNAVSTYARYFAIESYPAAAHSPIIGGVFCADPQVITSADYHTGNSSDLQKKANNLEMTLDPNRAISNHLGKNKNSAFQMSSDKQKQMQVLAYLYQGGDPRLEYVKADKSVAAQEFIRQNQEVFDAYNTAMAQFAGKTVPQKNGMAQVIAWYITKGQWWQLDDPNLNAAAWTAYNNIVKLAGQPLKLWEAYQALKKNQNIKDK